MTAVGKLIDSWWERGFQQLGAWIARYRYACILLSMLITLIGSAGLSKLSMHDNMRGGYIPTHGPGHDDMALFQDIFQYDVDVIRACSLIFECDDGGSLLRPEPLLGLADFVRVVQNISVSVDGVDYRYRDFCEPFCEHNDVMLKTIVRQSILEAFAYQLEHNSTYMGEQLNHPFIYMESLGLTVPSYRYLVDAKTTNSNLTTPDGWPHAGYTNVRSVSIIPTNIFATNYNGASRHAYTSWELTLFEYLMSKQYSPALRISMYGDDIYDFETRRVGKSSLLPILCGASLTLLFVHLSSFVGNAIDYSFKFMFWAVTAAMLSPCMAVCTSFGLFMFAGYQVTSLICVIPCLVMGIGVDDAFLIMNDWQHCMRTKQFRESDSERRLSTVLGHVGPSLTVTSLTNVVAFTMGLSSDIANIRSFSAFTAVAILLDYVYELLFFSAFLIVLQDRETTNSGRITDEHVKLRSADTHDSIERENCSNATQQLSGGREKSLSDVYKETIVYEAPAEKEDRPIGVELYVHKWCDLLSHCHPLRIGLVGVHLLLLVISIYGISRMPVEFDPTSTLLPDSILQNTSAGFDKYWSTQWAIMFFFTAPPDISNATDLAHFKATIKEMELFPKAYGSQRHLVWLNDYEKWYFEDDTFGLGLGLEQEKDRPFSYDRVPEFLELPRHLLYKDFVQWTYNGSTVVVTSMSSELSFHDYATWADRANFYFELRDRLPQFDYGIRVWDYECGTFDLMHSVRTEITMFLVVLIVCMGAMCALFVPHAACLMCALLNITTITLTCLGSMGLLGLYFDPNTLLGVLMMVGFTVDYTAHVTVHFYRSRQLHEPTERLYHVLRTVTKPMLQAAGSTLLCVLPLYLTWVPSYQLFVLCISLVIVSGCAHALCWLPLYLTLIPDRWLST